MTTKVKLQYIANDSQRKVTFRKRKSGLVKKVTELTTLCDVEACAIIYGPYDAQPEVWPSQAGAQRLLSRFKRLPEMDQTRNMLNQECFLKQRLHKENDRLKRQCEANREKEMTGVMNEALAVKLSSRDLVMMDRNDLNDLGWVIEQKWKSVKRRVRNELIRGASSSMVVPPPLDAGAASSSMVAPPPPPDASAEIGEDPQWFRDMLASYDNVAGFEVGASGDDIILPPFGDGNPSDSNQYFP